MMRVITWANRIRSVPAKNMDIPKIPNIQIRRVILNILLSIQRGKGSPKEIWGRNFPKKDPLGQ